MNKRLMTLAGLLKEEFELPDESPFEGGIPAGTFLEMKVDFADPIKPKLQYIMHKRGSMEAESKKQYQELLKRIMKEEGVDQEIAKTLIYLDEDDNSGNSLWDNVNDYGTYYFDSTFPRAEGLMDVYKEKGSSIEWNDVQEFTTNLY